MSMRLLYDFKLFRRNVSQQKAVALFSICNLSVAIAVVILIGVWAYNEFNYDSFHQDKEQIYRIREIVERDGVTESDGAVYRFMGPYAIQHCPEVSAMCRILPTDFTFEIENKIYRTDKIFMVDSNFFTFFTFKLKSGDPHSCLASPDGVVIDEYMAKRYFPDKNPLGEEIKINGARYTVTALMENMPANSHIRMHMVFPFWNNKALDDYYGIADYFVTYLKMPAPFDRKALEKKLEQGLYTISHLFEEIGMRYKLEPLSEIHFSQSMEYHELVTGNKKLVITFILVALIILFMACVNFINLFISSSFLRAKSIGVKKTCGEGKGDMIRGFYRETFYYALISTLLGLLWAILLLPYFNRLSGADLNIGFGNGGLYLFLGGVVGTIVVTAGTFPAFYMTRFNAVVTLKGQFKGKKLSLFQKILIITQFVVTIVILLCVFFIHKQVGYMLHKDLGFNKENVMYVVDKGGIIENYPLFAAEMKKYPGITDVTLKDELLEYFGCSDGVRRLSDGQTCLIEICYVGSNFLDFMKMRMLEGNNFDDFSTANECILNESAARELKISEPGEEILYRSGLYRVRGIVADIQTQSLHQQVMSQVFLLHPRKKEYGAVLFFKLAGDPREAIRRVKSYWEEANPGYLFEYHFLDEAYARLYKAETDAVRILEVAMGIVWVISLAGLFAMVYYTMQRRQKEIGVRKVNGATVMNLFVLLNRHFVIWVGIAFILACPIAYVIMTKWLEDYMERTPLSWWVFAGVGVLALVIVIATVSYQTWRAACIDPVKVLKSE